MLKSGGLRKKLVIALCIAGFGSAGSSQAKDSHSAYIPADTPFYIGTEEGFPVEVMLAFAPSASIPMPEDSDSEGQEIIEALNDFMGNLETILPEWGVGENLNFSTYAVGLYPVVRIALADTKKFNAQLAALETEHNLKPQAIDRPGFDIRLYGENSLAALDKDDAETATEKEAANDSVAEAAAAPGVVIATSDTDLVIALVSNAGEAAQLDRVIGIDKPDATMAQSGKLDKIKKRWGYGDQYAGFIDTSVVTDILTSNKSQASKDIAALNESDADSRAFFEMMQSEPCRGEINSVSDNWPMVVMGLQDMNVSEDEISYVSHMATEIGHTQLKETLKLVRGVLPASQSAAKALISIGLGISVDSLTQFVGQLTGLLTSIKYECELLTDLNKLATADLSAASMGVVMFGGMARGVEGVSFNIFDIIFSDDGGSDPIKGADLALVLNAKDPQVLVQTLQMMPQLGILSQLPLDGSEISLNDMLPVPVPEGVELKAAVKDKNIVIFGGEKASEYVGRLAGNGEGGFFRAQIDTANIIDKVTSVMQMMGQSSEQLEDTMAYMKGYPKGTIDYTVDFTDNGIELLSTAVIDRSN